VGRGQLGNVKTASYLLDQYRHTKAGLPDSFTARPLPKHESAGSSCAWIGEAAAPQAALLLLGLCIDAVLALIEAVVEEVRARS
jgi:hypothetical protein